MPVAVKSKEGPSLHALEQETARGTFEKLADLYWGRKGSEESVSGVRSGASGGSGESERGIQIIWEYVGRCSL